MLVLTAAALVCALPGPASAVGEEVSVMFEFSPAKPSYAPGESFSVEFTVRNAMLSSPVAAPQVRVWNVSAHFSWMAPNEWSSKDVSSESRWLSPGEMQSFLLNLSVPANASERTYGYILRVEYSYVIAPEWGPSPSYWESVPYHDFVVGPLEQAAPPAEEPAIDLGLIVALIALLLAVGALGAYLYYTRGSHPGRGAPSEAGARLPGLAEAPLPKEPLYPAIRPSSGEQFPIERGFIYLVKEKRPNIGFAMFNHATKHGAKGLIVAREHPNRLKQLYEFEASKILWLTRRVGVDHIDPTELSLLSLEMTKFVESNPKSVVLLEGLEYMITQNDFESVLRFVNHLHDVILAHDCAIIIVIDPRVLSTRELALLERSTRVVEPAEELDGQQQERHSERAGA